MKQETGTWIQTYTSKRVQPLNLTNDQIDIEDIAHSLSNTCRFNGHVKEFYSVAQHCVLMSNIVPYQYEFAALMHDACECYTSDIPHPIKSSVGIVINKNKIQTWEAWEEDMLKIIFNKYNIPFSHLKEIKNADRRLCTTEEIALFNTVSDAELEKWPPYEDVKITSWSPSNAKIIFLSTFKELYEDVQSQISTQ